MKFYLKLLFYAVFAFNCLNASENYPTKEEVAKLYVATFNRAPDSAGLNYWTNDSGLKLSGISKSFFDAPETKALYPEETSNRDFVRSVYVNLFNREPDSAGWDYWEAELDAGSFSKNRFIEAVINGALDSDDFLDATILTNKTIVGLSFSEAGLSDVDDARTIMANISEDIATVQAAVNSFGISLVGTEIPNEGTASYPIILAIGEVHAGKIGANNSSYGTSLYKFTATQTGYYNIVVDSLNPESDIDLAIYNSNQEMLAIAGDYSKVSESLQSQYLQKDSFYYIEVGNVDSVDTNYQILVSLDNSTSVNNTPIAKISASSTNLIYKTTVNYLDAFDTHDPYGTVSWIGWKYDDEGSYTMGSLTEKHTINTFLTLGTHTIKLMLFDNNGDQVATDTIDVSIGFATPEPRYGCPITGTDTTVINMPDGATVTCSYTTYGISKDRLNHEIRQHEDAFGLYKDGYETIWNVNGYKSSETYWQDKSSFKGSTYDANGKMIHCSYSDGSSCMP